MSDERMSEGEHVVDDAPATLRCVYVQDRDSSRWSAERTDGASGRDPD